MQVYRFLDIGSSKVLKSDQAGIPHHLIDFLNPDEEFTAGQYMALGRRALSEIGQRGNLPLLAGGTGLYLRALLNGLFDGPTRCESLRERLQQQARRKGEVHLHHLLAKVDPESARRISPRDRPKIIRALEVYFLTAKPLSVHFRTATQKLKGFRLLKIGLGPARDRLYRRIEERVDRMFAGGLVEEVRSILAKGYSSDCKPLQSLGYLQAVQFLGGEMSLQAAADATKQATRNFAKRQFTWFRKEEKVTWFPGFRGRRFPRVRGRSLRGGIYPVRDKAAFRDVDPSVALVLAGSGAVSRNGPEPGGYSKKSGNPWKSNRTIYRMSFSTIFAGRSCR